MCYLRVRAFYFSSAIATLLLRSASDFSLTSEAKGLKSGPQRIKGDFFHATHDINKSYLVHSGLDSLVFEISGNNLSRYL